MQIAYINSITNKTGVINLAPGINPEQGARANNIEDGTWWEVTPQEAEELQKPTLQELEEQKALEAKIKLEAEAKEFLLELMQAREAIIELVENKEDIAELVEAKNVIVELVEDKLAEQRIRDIEIIDNGKIG